VHNDTFISTQTKEKSLLHWFGQQDSTTQEEVFRLQHSLFLRAKDRSLGIGLARLSIQCLYEAIKASGWQDEQDYRNGKAVSDVGLKRIAKRRRRRALRYRSHRDRIRTWLHRNWGIVEEQRRIGLSWRRISQMIHSEYKISVSHTTLIKYEDYYHD